MKLTMTSGLLISSLKITHKGKSKILNGMIIDTGSAHTWINLDAVEDELDIAPEDGDQIVTSFGIGGRDVANRKRVDHIQFGSFSLENFQVDFGLLDLDIDGLIGLDLLTEGGFVINLAKMELHQENG